MENTNKYSCLDSLLLCHDRTLEEIHKLALEMVDIFRASMKELGKIHFSTEIGIYQIVENLANDYLAVKTHRLTHAFVHKALAKKAATVSITDIHTQIAECRTKLLSGAKELFILHFHERYGSFESFRRVEYTADESLQLMCFTALFGQYVILQEIIAGEESSVIPVWFSWKNIIVKKQAYMVCFFFFIKYDYIRHCMLSLLSHLYLWEKKKNPGKNLGF